MAVNTTDTIAMRPLLFPDDLQFWYETLRWLRLTAYGGADFGEVVTTAQPIAAGDYDSWYERWAATAARVEAEARGQLAAGHKVSGRDGLLRAATYFRSAEFFTRDADPDPRGRAAYDASVRCFADAAALMSPAVTPVTIPFEGTALPGYLYQPPRGGPQATLIMHSGFDGWAEELHHTGALACPICVSQSMSARSPMSTTWWSGGRWKGPTTAVFPARPRTRSAAVGRTVPLTGTDIVRIEDGKFAEYWLNCDSLFFLQQIGFKGVPTPA